MAASSGSGSGSRARVRALTASEAAAIDVALMRPIGATAGDGGGKLAGAFTLAQLMELAGLAVATAMAKTFPLPAYRRVVVLCGPGNNGGDGLVAARHLALFGYSPTIVLPKRGRDPHYVALEAQARDAGVPILAALPPGAPQFDAIIDALFGFSFAGPPRPPFDALIALMAGAARGEAAASGGGSGVAAIDPASAVASVVEVAPAVPVLSVDVPSGWHVEEGDTYGTGFMPTALVSLTAPKLCSRYFTGRAHWLGGRFVPPALAAEYGLDALPRYEGAEQVVALPPAAAWEVVASSSTTASALGPPPHT